MKGSQFLNDQSQQLPIYKIIILGKSSVGKSKLLVRYKQNFYDDFGVATVSIDFQVVKRSNALFYYYDTAGQEQYSAIVDHYYRGSDACIIAYDVSNPSSFNEISKYYNKIKEMTEDSLIYIIGCKNDLQKKVADEQVRKNFKGIKHFSTSAKFDEGVKQAFYEIECDLKSLKHKQVNKSKIKNIFQLGKGIDSNPNSRNNHPSTCCKNH